MTITRAEPYNPYADSGFKALETSIELAGLVEGKVKVGERIYYKDVSGSVIAHLVFERT
jgi:hypothetical protein